MKTMNNHQKVKHQNHNNRTSKVGQVKIDFTNKPLTAWGGLCSTVAKYLEEIEFKEWVKTHIPVREKSPNSKGIYEKVLALFLTSLSGGSRFSHVAWWGHGIEAVKASFGVKWLPQSASVLTRFFAKFEQSHNESLRKSVVKLAYKLIEHGKVSEDVLILDSTVCERYGSQEGACKGYNPRKPGRPSHHPLKAFLGSGYVVNLWNRRGDTHTAHQCILFHKLTLLELPGWLRIKWTLADSGFGEEKFLEYMESRGHRYIVALRLTACVQCAIYFNKDWKQLAPGIEIWETEARLSTWEKFRRLIVIRQNVRTRPKAAGKQPLLFKELEEHRDYRYSVLVTNDSETSAEDIWALYRPRANVENCIKELKGGYGWHEFNVHSFWGTEAVMILIGMVFYNLIHHLNRCVLKTEKGVLVKLKTMRLKVFAIPAIYGRSGRCPTLRLGVSDGCLRDKILGWLERIEQLGLRLFKCNAIGPPETVKI
jgi:hypothetical protein